MKRSSWLWPIALILAAFAAGLVNFALNGVAIRPLIVIGFLLVCPGMSLVRLLRLREAVVEWTLAIALSIALDAIITSIQLYARLWSPAGSLVVLMVICLGGAVAQLIAAGQFAVQLQKWTLRWRIADRRQHKTEVHHQQADSVRRVRQAELSPIALAALARLRSKGVSDDGLLDSMLERGEEWLDQTMQCLDYCEHFGAFVIDDYTQWCTCALKGTFDWIDSLRYASAKGEAPSALETASEAGLLAGDNAGAVEAAPSPELASEEDKDDFRWQEEITVKRAAVKFPQVGNVTTAEVEPTPSVDTASSDRN